MKVQIDIPRIQDREVDLDLNDYLTMLTIIRKGIRKTGGWINFVNIQGGIQETWHKCSECGWSNALSIPRNYCPRCGIKMKESEADDIARKIKSEIMDELFINTDKEEENE